MVSLKCSRNSANADAYPSFYTNFKYCSQIIAKFLFVVFVVLRPSLPKAQEGIRKLEVGQHGKQDSFKVGLPVL